MKYLQIIFLVLFTLVVQSSFAQNFSKGNYNFRSFEQKPFYFGIQLGGGSSGYKISQSRAFYNEEDFQVIESPLNPGLTISFIANLKIGEYFDFRSTPGFMFTQREFEFYTDGPDPVIQSLETYTFDVPLLLRYKSAPYKDKRFFVLAGVKYVYDFSSNANAEQGEADNLLILSPHDFQIEIGVGVQVFMPYFIFSPQLTFSQSISNIHILKSGLAESRIIDQVLSRLFTISINLEG